MTIYSCRAECEHDVGVFVERMNDLRATPLQVNYLGMTEWAIEFDSPLSIEQVRDVLRTEIDTHVMIETLRALPLSHNKLERDNSIDCGNASFGRDEVLTFDKFSKKLPFTCKIDIQTGKDYDNRDRPRQGKVSFARGFPTAQGGTLRKINGPFGVVKLITDEEAAFDEKMRYAEATGQYDPSAAFNWKF